MCALVEPWAEAQSSFRAAHCLGVSRANSGGGGCRLSNDETVYISHPKCWWSQMEYMLWSGSFLSQRRDAFPPSVCHTLSHTVGGHIRPTSAQVDRYIIQSISKSALYLHVWVDYMHVLLLNK